MQTTKAALVVGLFVSMCGAVVALMCNTGLSTNYLGTTCVNNPPDSSYGSYEYEYDPASTTTCTVLDHDVGEKCNQYLDPLFKKTTLWSAYGCATGGGYVVSTTGWVSLGNHHQDGLCSCP